MGTGATKQESTTVSPRPQQWRGRHLRHDIHFDNQDGNIGRAGNYEKNPRYTMNIRDEPQQMLRPIVEYGSKSLVTLEEACKPLESYVSDLPRHVWIAKKNSQHPVEGLSRDESGAIHLYTMEWHDSLYSVLNKTLREADRRVLVPWFLYLKLLITALFKLPSVRAVIWRGVSEDISDQYVVGDHKVWWSFSSCTASMNILENPMYLGNRGTRTLFSIEAFHGKMIKEHSFYKKENEVLLLPATYFEVTGNLNSGNGLHIIHLRQKRPPHTLLERPFQKQGAASFDKKLPVAKNQQGSALPQPQKNQHQGSHEVKKVIFSNIPDAKRGIAEIPTGYEGLDWEGFQYVEESYAQQHMVSAWQHVFKHSRYIIYNKSGQQKIYIRSRKPNKTFTIKSIDATVVDRDGSQWTLTGMRQNEKLYAKVVTFGHRGQYQLIELNFADIDEIIFTTFKGYPELAIGCINLIT